MIEKDEDDTEEETIGLVIDLLEILIKILEDIKETSMATIYVVAPVLSTLFIKTSSLASKMIISFFKGIIDVLSSLIGKNKGDKKGW